MQEIPSPLPSWLIATTVEPEESQPRWIARHPNWRHPTMNEAMIADEVNKQNREFQAFMREHAKDNWACISKLDDVARKVRIDA